MNSFIIPLLLAIGFALGGCSTTTVILLPDENGKTGAVSVKTQAGAQTLDQPYHYVTAKDISARPSEAREMSEARVNAEFRELLQAQPTKPVSFILYFVTGTTNLTEDSRADIPRVLEAARQRSPTLISIIGHTDSTGTEEINAALSLERAKAVEKLLKEHDPALNNIELKYFGEKEPLIPTPPNTPEPRNRRVEIMIL